MAEGDGAVTLDHTRDDHGDLLNEKVWSFVTRPLLILNYLSRSALSLFAQDTNKSRIS